MTDAAADMIVPARFPELAKLVWNRDMDAPLPREHAFALYERNWRHVDADHLMPHEAELIAQLTREFGHGRMLIG